MDELIAKNVRSYISSFANLPIPKFKDDDILQKQPLKLDDTKLSFLALSLRGYAKSIKPSATVLAKELRKKDFKVKDTIELIIKKVSL